MHGFPYMMASHACLHSHSQVYMSTKPSSGKRRPPSKDRVVPIRITPDEHTRIAQLAAADGRTMTNFMRRMYQRGLADYLAATEVSHG